MLKRKIGTLDELKANNQFSRWIENHDILIYRLNNELRAISNICPHFGGPIGYHEIKKIGKKKVFTCLWHNLQFCADSGKCVTHGNLKLRKYKVEVVRNDIFVYIN